jgi:hypothetical protein
VVTNFALLLLLTQDPAAAAATRDQAQLHVKLGNESLRAGQAERAIAEYTSAHRLFPSAKILVNLGQAFERVLQPAQALWCFEHFLDAHQDTDGSADPELLAGLAYARRRRQVLREQVTAEKPTEINDPSPADSVAIAPAPTPVPPKPVPLRPSLAAPLSVAEVRPTPPSGKTKWIIAGAVVVTGAVATFFLVRALRPGCPAQTCVPSD